LAVITSGIWLSKGRALSAPSADLLAYLTIAIYVFVLGTIPSRCYWLARVAREHLRRLPGGQYVQANPSQSKQKWLVLLRFIRPNRDFSMGCRGKSKKILSSLCSLSGVARGASANLARRREYSTDF
jgi:hypothetical protein